jgi:hypothetical protein
MNHPKFVDTTLTSLHDNNEWAHEILHTSFEDLNFHFASTSIKMHYSCPKTSIYVPIARVIFHHTIIDQVQIQHCFEA